MVHRYKLTQEDVVRGGKRVSIAKKIARRKNCNSKCPIFAKCWIKHVAERGKYEGKCALNQTPPSVRRATVKMVTEGVEGITEIIQNTAAEYNLLIHKNKTPKAMKEFWEMLLKTKDSIYGRKTILEGELNTNVITADDFSQAYDNYVKSKREDNERNTGSSKE